MKGILSKLFNLKFLFNYLVLKIININPYLVSDKKALKSRFYFEFGRSLNLKDPKTYSEKLQWMKLYYRKPIMIQMVDKNEAKNYVSKIIGNQYIIPTIGVWENFDDIDFTSLPDRFVLKTTHDSGSVIVVRDKLTFDKALAKSILEKSMKNDFYIKSREWPYKDVPRRIIAEKYMEDESGELRDYKFFCFDGKIRCLYVATDRLSHDEELKFDYFDENFNHLQIVNGHPNSQKQIVKPDNFDDMKCIAEKLSSGFPHLRVDLYSINGEIYFGELTFFSNSGMLPFKPEEWDYKLGEWLHLPNNYC